MMRLRLRRFCILSHNPYPLLLACLSSRVGLAYAAGLMSEPASRSTASQYRVASDRLAQRQAIWTRACRRRKPRPALLLGAGHGAASRVYSHASIELNMNNRVESASGSRREIFAPDVRSRIRLRSWQTE